MITFETNVQDVSYNAIDHERSIIVGRQIDHPYQKGSQGIALKMIAELLQMLINYKNEQSFYQPPLANRD